MGCCTMQINRVGMGVSKRDAFIKEVAGDGGAIVPVDEFLKVVTQKTGWSMAELKSKDMGEIEKKLNVKAVKPHNLRSIKRGKSFNDLYMFMDADKKQKALNSIENILS